MYDPDEERLDELLSPPAAEVDAGFRRTVLARTTRLVRRRRRLTQASWWAALAACFVAGLVASYGIWPSTPPEPPPAVSKTEPLTPEPATATALEWAAIDHPDRAAPLYQAAGDRYLAEDADPGAAVRCYGNALDAGSPADLTIQSTDSWLLMAIKDARQKETHDATRVQ
jgi:hypothetical protein